MKIASIATNLVKMGNSGRISPWDELNSKFKADDSANRCKISGIEPSATKYGCPAHKLTAAMWDDLVDIVDKAGMFCLTPIETSSYRILVKH